jgi:hypothetical protein
MVAVVEISPTTRAVVRPAQPGDNAARCELFARVAMESDLVLSVRRDPDFDALYRLQSEDWLSVVVELDGAVEGTGTIVVRDGYVGGAVRKVGYLGDLRLSPVLQGRLLLDRFYGTLLEDVRARYGCELFLTSVIATNERALRALTRPTSRSRRAGRPEYTAAGDFDIRSLHLLLPRRADGSDFRIRRATWNDLTVIAHLLDEDGRTRPFGFVFSETELARRLRAWPGFSIESFYVAEDAAGEIVGSIALWDAAPVKRMVVREYRGAMRRLRAGYNVAAAFLGRPGLPTRGGMLRYQYVTHQAIKSNDPRVLRALLARAHRDVRRTGYHFLSICAPHGSALEPAFRGFHATNLGARLFVVSLPGVDLTDVLPIERWPGFEMALV